VSAWVSFVGQRVTTLLARARSRLWFATRGSLRWVCGLRDNQRDFVSVRSAEACASVGYDNCFSLGGEELERCGNR